MYFIYLIFLFWVSDPHMKGTHPNEEASAHLDHLEGKKDLKEQLEEALEHNTLEQAIDQATTNLICYLTLQDPWGKMWTFKTYLSLATTSPYMGQATKGQG